MSFGVAVLLTVREMSYLWWKRRALARRDMEPVQVASATAGVESAAGAKARISRRSFAARLKRLRKKSEKQIPRGLKPTRNDKNKGLVTAHLKVRPFETRSNRLFQQPLKPCPSTGSYGPHSCSYQSSAAQTALTSVYISSTSCPISRPQPDCLYPPKGREASKTL